MQSSELKNQFPEHLQSAEKTEQSAFQRYSYYEGLKVQPSSFNKINFLKQTSIQSNQGRMTQSNNNFIYEQQPTIHQKMFKLSKLKNTSHQNPRLKNQQQNAFYRKNYGQIYINDYEYQNRSKTAQGNRRCLSVQKIYMEIEPSQQNHERKVDKLGQRNVYSRENIQQMNKKTRSIRAVRYSSNGLLPNSPKQIQSNNQIKLKGYSQGFQTTTSFKTGKDIRRKQFYRGSSTQNIFQTRQQRNQKDPSEFSNNYGLSSKISPKKQKSTEQAKQSPQKPNYKQIVKPNNFRPTIKTKSIDQNPNILANIIRKKVACLDRGQLIDYLQKIMKKGSK